MDDKIAISELLAKLEELEGQGKQELSLTPLATSHSPAKLENPNRNQFHSYCG